MSPPARRLHLLPRRPHEDDGYPARTGALARAVIVAHWPLGLTKVAWRYLWRTVPMHRTDVAGDRGDLPDPVPARFCDDRIQLLDHGVGTLLHRRYAARISDPTVSAEQLIGRLAADPNSAAPHDAAVFVKTRGGAAALEPGDEFVVRMPGPWTARFG